MSVLVAVDFSNVVRMCLATAQLGSEAGVDVMELLRMHLRRKLSSIEDDLGVPYPAFLMVMDDRPEWKHQAFPAYKQNRTPLDFDPRPSAARYLAKEFGCRFVLAPGQEADDAIAVIAARHPGTTVIVSGDRDLWQLYDPPRVKVYSPLLRRHIKLEDIEKAFSVGPKHIRLVKSLWGDAGDNIPNVVPRMQKQLLPLIRLSDGTVLDLLAQVKDGVSPRCLELLDAGLEQMLLNYALVGLNPSVQLSTRDMASGVIEPWVLESSE